MKAFAAYLGLTALLLTGGCGGQNDEGANSGANDDKAGDLPMKPAGGGGANAGGSPGTSGALDGGRGGSSSAPRGGASGTGGNSAAGGDTQPIKPAVGGTAGYKGPFCEGTGSARKIIGLLNEPAPADVSVDEARRFNAEALNTIRAMTGLRALDLDDCLNDLAQKGNDLWVGGGAVHGHFSDQCLSKNMSPQTRDCGCGWIQENQGNAGGSTTTWKKAIHRTLCEMMDEPLGVGHRGNIQSAVYTKVGVGIKVLANGAQYTHDFGR